MESYYSNIKDKDNKYALNIIKEIQNIKSIYEKKQFISKIIKTMDKNELIQVYEIFKSESEKMSVNKNGVFIDLMKTKEHTIDRIIKFIFKLYSYKI